MRITVSIKVRNSEWYQTIDELKKSKSASMCAEEWVAMNEDKIEKHSSFIDFEYSFFVNRYQSLKKECFDLEVISLQKDSNSHIKNTIHLDNVCVVEFIGDNTSSFVVISKELLFQKFIVEKDLNNCEYIYFYLKENTDHNRLNENIWLSDDCIENIKKKFGNFDTENDSNIKLIREGNHYSI